MMKDEFSVHVPRGDFVSALKVFSKVAKSAKRFRAAQFTLAPVSGGLELIGPGAAVRMHGEGVWLGRATFGPAIVFGNLRAPPSEERIVIRTDTRRVWFGTSSVACVWHGFGQVQPDEPIGLPKPSDYLDALELELKYSDAILITQGYTKDLFAARNWRKQRIVDALISLAEFGVTYDDLADVVKRAIERRVQ